MFTTIGCWMVYSKTDPRWNGNGEAEVGMFVMPQEAKDFIEQKKSELKSEPPEDLEWSYHKY